ncbi:hypothetical protein BS47DRAFT_1310964 [Hydnum rufescens UP504]|uniref:WD40 repeat-like protein n=1 Tax=Hydnum rufescens UP504 TaxID=1448309 RepID=A0A9P6BBC1_9AGAM|nr:hypothetical protein BS47DRAFT_1310964 [Hydnum rufescens UP504]
MNIELLNPFGQQDIPESVSTTLEDWAACARFNPTGRFIAAGRFDGWTTIWDLDTQGVLRSLEGHSKTVTSVSWSRNSRYVMTSSRDWNCVLWDLETGDRVKTIRFDCPASGASLHPRNSKISVVVLASGQCIVLDMRWNRTERSELMYSEANETSSWDGDDGPSRPSTSMTVARFSPDGTRIFVGTSTGDLLVFDLRTKQILHREKVANNAIIRHLEFDRSGRRLAMSSNDRIVRTYEVSYSPLTMEPLHKLQDKIGRTQWNGISWSGNGEYIIGGAALKAAHTIYVWDHETGTLDKILEGPREPLQDVHCHPARSSICSVNTAGLIYVWATVTTEKWGAFAANFEELDENVEYEEREDEFDIEDEEVLKKRKQDREDIDVDVTSVDDEPESIRNVPYYSSNDTSDRTASARWFLEDPDDDTVPDYFPPVFMEDESPDDVMY